VLNSTLFQRLIRETFGNRSCFAAPQHKSYSIDRGD
jgi:hypothetical protein